MAVEASRQPLRLGCLCAAWAAAGCAASGSASQATGDPPPRPAASDTPGEPHRQVAIHFDVQGTPTRLPLLRAHVNGRPTSLLVDTGATDHAIALWLARALGIALHDSPGDLVADHAGGRVSVQRTAGVTIDVDGWGPVAEASFLVVDTPEVFARSDVGGILSPQLLAVAGESVRLDLRRGRMALEPAADAEARLATEPGCWLSPSPRPACASAGAGEGTPLFVLPSRVGARSIGMLVDTGAVRTDVEDSVVPGGAAGEPRTAFTLSGASTTPTARAAVRVGGCSFEREVDVVSSLAESTCTREGSLGIDFLASCDLAIDRGRLWGRCGATPE